MGSEMCIRDRNNNSNSDGSHVVNILNQHQDAISALEVAAHSLERDVTVVGRMLEASSN